MPTIQLRELAQLTSQSRVDEKNGFITSVKLLGRHSANDREYHPDAMKEAVRLYHMAPVYLGHKTREGENREGTKIGWVQNPRLSADGNAIYGDVRLLTKHPLVPPILQSAQLNPRLFGMSHDAFGVPDETGKVIRAISSVESVDVVDRPASTAGFFEALHPQKGKAPMRRRPYREDAVDGDPMYDNNATPGSAGSDDFEQAVQLLKSCLSNAGPRHSDEWQKDVQKALDILEPWLQEEDAADQGDTSSQESRRSAAQPGTQRLRERQPACPPPKDAKEFINALEQRAKKGASRKSLRM